MIRVGPTCSQSILREGDRGRADPPHTHGWDGDLKMLKTLRLEVGVRQPIQGARWPRAAGKTRTEPPKSLWRELSPASGDRDSGLGTSRTVRG